MSSLSTYHDIKTLPLQELRLYLAEHIKHLVEDEALAVLENPHCNTPICQAVAQSTRLTGFYSVRLRLVAHRATPQAHATKLVFYLHWPDLVRLSLDVKVKAPVRRAIDTQLLVRLDKLTLGEKIETAKRCSAALIKALLFDSDLNVFASLLINQRVREDELVFLAGSPRASPEQLRLLAADPKWSYRYAIRKALVLNPLTPRSAAASLLRHLTRRDRQLIHSRPETSVYLRRCIERIDGAEFSSAPERIDYNGRTDG